MDSDFLFHGLTGQCASKVFKNEKVLYLASFCTVMVTEGNNLLEYRASHLRNAPGSGKGRDRQFKTAWFSIPLHIIFWRQWNHTSTKQTESEEANPVCVSSSECTFLLYATANTLKAFAPYFVERNAFCVYFHSFISKPINPEMHLLHAKGLM